MINTPGGQNSDSGLGFILGIILAIVLVAVFFVYVLPVLREDKSSDINVTVPLPGSGSENDSGGNQ